MRFEIGLAGVMIFLVSSILAMISLGGDESLVEQLAIDEMLNVEMDSSEVMQEESEMIDTSEVMEQEMDSSEVMQEEMDSSEVMEEEMDSSEVMQEESEMIDTSEVMQEEMDSSEVMQEESEMIDTSEVMQEESEMIDTSEVMQEESEMIDTSEVMEQETISQKASVELAIGSSTPVCAETNECFIPHTVVISVNGLVTWNNDDAAHTVTAGNQDTYPNVGLDHYGGFDSGLFIAQTTFTHTFEEVGEYPYYCQVHPWMQGTVIVK